tara:strand:- start:1956 stop:3599 length:1644 start_codon:yes stop_codon:yes gene_type:complete
MTNMRKRFDAQKQLTPDDPYRFDFTDLGLPVVKALREQLPQKRQEFEQAIKLIREQTRSSFRPNWAKRMFPNLVGKQKSIQRYKLALKYLDELEAELDGYIGANFIDYKSIQEVGYFFSRISGVFDTKKLNLRDRIMLSIDRYLQGYKAISVEEEYELYKARNFSVFQKESPVDGFRDAHKSFEEAFFNKDKFELASIPTAEHLGPDIFMKLLPNNIYIQGISLNPAAADGFVRPGGDFWLHDIRHSSAIFKKKIDYENLHGINEERASVMMRKMDRWKVELDEERSKIESKELRYAIGFFMFNFHHDRGFPMVPSSYLKESLDKVPYLLYAMLKVSDQHLGFENPHATLTEAYSWLKKFWRARLEEEQIVFKLTTADQFKVNPFSINEGEQILIGTSGVEVEGHVKTIIRNQEDKPIYFNTEGPTQLTYFQKPIAGQGFNQHPHGFGSPIGRLKNVESPLEDLSKEQLIELGIEDGKRVNLEFESGVKVDGELVATIRKNGKVIIQTFKDATVTDPEGKVLFKPAWGTYDMLIAEDFIGSFPISKE